MGKMQADELQGIAFQIILESGEARNLIHLAFEQMRNAKFLEAEGNLQKGKNAIVRAHNSQADLLQKYASGENFNIDLLLVHSQDHLMTTLTLNEVAFEMLHLYRRIT